MSEEAKTIKHPSFGLIAFDRGTYAESLDGTGHDRPLFGSSILHNSFISVTIRRAQLERRLNNDSIMADDSLPIIEIEMSTTQFADAITSLNQGEGTPCTIKMINRKKVSEPPFQNKRIQFDAEFETEMRNVASDTNKFYTNISQILDKPSIGKHDREEIMAQLGLLRQELSANMPFIKKQFTEQMDQTVLEAKNDVEAFLEGKVRKLGLEGFTKELMLLRKDTIASLESKGEGKE